MYVIRVCEKAKQIFAMFAMKGERSKSDHIFDCLYWTQKMGGGMGLSCIVGVQSSCKY
jgi:hypothetical protein